MYEYDSGSILISLIITLALYCAFPLLSANYCKTPKNKKKYILTCYGVNLIVWVGFFILTELLTGDTSSGGAYILWTGVFSAVGIKTLDNRGMLIQNEKPITNTSSQIKSVLNCETEDERIAYFKEEYQNENEKKLNKILNGDYSKEAKTAVRIILDERRNNNNSSSNEIKQGDNECHSQALPLKTVENECKPAEADIDVKMAETPQILFCRNCGNKLPQDSKFCNKCGLKIE